MTVTKADVSVTQRLIDLGLDGYEARVLVALAGLGEADTKELAAASGVPRTSVYEHVDRLVKIGMVDRLSKPGTGRWAFRSWATVIDVLGGDARARYEAELGRIVELSLTVGLSGALPL